MARVGIKVSHAPSGSGIRHSGEVNKEVLGGVGATPIVAIEAPAPPQPFIPYLHPM